MAFKPFFYFLGPPPTGLTPPPNPPPPPPPPPPVRSNVTVDSYVAFFFAFKDLAFLLFSPGTVMKRGVLFLVIKIKVRFSPSRSPGGGFPLFSPILWMERG